MKLTEYHTLAFFPFCLEYIYCQILSAIRVTSVSGMYLECFLNLINFFVLSYDRPALKL